MKIILVVYSLVCVSCTSFNMADANRLSKGMTPDMVLGLVSKGPRTTVTFTIPSEPRTTFTAQVSDLALGSAKADYYAVFEEGELVYWGHPYEFNRYPDPRMNEIGAAAVAAAQ